MIKMTNVPMPTMPILNSSSGYNSATTKKTQHNAVKTVAVASALRCVADDTDESDEDSESELEIEEDDVLLDEADDVLQIDSEDEAELEAQRIRLDDMKAAAAKSQVSNGNFTKETASRKPRGRPPGSANIKHNKHQRNKNKQNNSSSSCANANVQASASVAPSTVVIGQIYADEKAQRLIYGCVGCSLLYGDATSLFYHWHKEHMTQVEKERKRNCRKSPVREQIKYEPPIELADGCKLSDFKFCAQLLMLPFDENQELHCSFCSAAFSLSTELQLHLGEQHSICKLLVPKEEPSDPMISIPGCDFSLGRINGKQVQTPVEALPELPETPPPEKETAEKDDIAMISALVAEIATESNPKVSKMIIKLPVGKRGKRKRKQIDQPKLEKQSKKQKNEKVQQSQAESQPDIGNGKGKRLLKSQKTAVSVKGKQPPRLEAKKEREKHDQRKKENEQEIKSPNQVNKNANLQENDQQEKATEHSQPKIKIEPGPRRARKARRFVDYVVDVKDEEDESEEDKDTDSDADVGSSTPHNSSDDSQTASSIKRELSEESKRIGIMHTCNFCSKTFQRFSRLQDHLRLHTGEKPHVCGQCGRAFRLKMRLAEHQLRHRTEKAYKCELCALPLATKQDMSLHMRHHKNDRRYKCDCCGKGFVRSSDLAIHVRVHTGEKPYSCDICAKAFRARQNLVVHRRTHLGDKPIQCEMCDKRFSRKIDMRVHMRRHTGEKPFSCSACQRGYSSRVNLQRHQQREHGEKRTRLLAEEPKSQPVTRRPRREKLQEKIAAQEKLLNELKRSLSTLGDIVEESPVMPLVEVKHKMSEFAADAGAGAEAGASHAQFSVTVSMQVESAKPDDDEEIIPEKENALSSGSTAAAVTTNVKLKANRKINSYFTVVGQQAEI